WELLGDAEPARHVRGLVIDSTDDGKHLTFDEIQAADVPSLTSPSINIEDLAVLLYTSGTTSDPKGVMLTHANLIGEADSVFRVLRVGPEDAILGVLPLFHALAQMANLLLPLSMGVRVVYLETLNTAE